MFTLFADKKNQSNETPFTTQYEVLKKYNLFKNDNGENVGMCRAMSNTYLNLVLQNKKTEDYLKDDKKFLREAIEEENRELQAEKEGYKDVDHFAFVENNTPHIDEKMSKSDLNEEKIQNLLEDSQHMLVTYPTEKNKAHEVYIGRKSSDFSSCRLFNSNVKGGERKGKCEDIIQEFVHAAQKEYVNEDQDFRVGRSAKQV